MFRKRQKRIAKEIELVVERLHKGENVYSKGEYYNEEFFIRSDLALIVLNSNNEILVSFADHTRPSYSALYALLLDEIEEAPLFICRDYKTDEKGSMIIDENDFSSTGDIIWDDKARYYSMLKKKVKHIVVRKTK
ncbi:MAG: hypothetical protein JRJ00_07725 [Deltaproteobacteria bacterium]|nr:hypothetical protein [Deltaproteobacteria bacterium]MBW1854554.1 hypothetical protein [Deltaproteobacteria bacterium]